MPKQYDTIVLGGGVIGCSIAFHLSKKGQRVLLLEKERIASQASSAAAGMLGVQTEMEEHGPLFDLARKSRAMFPMLSEELREITGMDIGLIRKGMLKLAVNNQQLEDYQQVLKWQKDQGEEAVWLDRDQLLQKEPCLSESILGSMYFPNEGHVSAPDLTIALGKAAAAYGTKWREFTEVDSLILDHGKVTGVSTNAGEFFGDSVVIASGAWSKKFLPEVGDAMYPVKGEALSVVTDSPVLERTIFSKDCYLVPKKGGEIIIGATSKSHTYDQKVTLGGISFLMEKAKELIPVLGTSEVNQLWSGTRPMTKGGLPWIGEHPEVNDLYLATGHYRNGILLSPVTGEIISNLIVGENKPEFDLRSFNPVNDQQKQGVSVR